MLRKISSPVLETLWGGGERPSTDAYKAFESASDPDRESEGFIVPIEAAGQHNPGRGKGPCFVHATEE